jgi:HD superfamily phosphohydrolase
MEDFDHKHIHDSVHGTIGLSHVEVEVVSSPIFQRLHNVKQLGLAYLVYPSLNYSRFSHSLGACHVMGRLLDAISRNGKVSISRPERQLYRLAALLHDIGHYPFSHAMEHSIDDFYKERDYLRSTTSNKADAAGSDPHSSNPPAFDHELLGRQILQHDPALQVILGQHSISSDTVKSVLSGESPEYITSLVSSDLDCDRLDYLLRTAHHSRLPYGGVDIDYIINQMSLDSERRLALANKALRAADHLLVSRYFDYLQVAFNKAVVALEWALADVIRAMLDRGIMDCSADTMLERVMSGEWCLMDDNYMHGAFATLRRSLGSDEVDMLLAAKLDAILRRIPPKLVVASERIADRNQKAMHNTFAQQLRDKIPSWSDEFRIPAPLWHVWSRSLQLTKIGSKVPASVLVGSQGTDELEASQAVYVLNSSGTTSRMIMEYDRSLMKHLAEFAYYGIRLYVCLTPDMEPDARGRIERRVRQDLPHFPYNE